MASVSSTIGDRRREVVPTKLYEVFTPELGVHVRYRMLSPEELEIFSLENQNLNNDEFMRAVLETVIFNLKVDVTEVLRKLSKNRGKEVLTALFHGCVMLNPSLDVRTWLKLAQGTAEIDGKKARIAKPGKLSRVKFLGLEAHLKEKVIGQDAAIEEIVQALKRSQVGLNDEERPLGVFLMAGGSGVGKTKLAKELHSYLFGDEFKLVRVDCGEYQHKHENQKLVGCFTPETKILMANGTSKLIKDITIGENVVSHLGVSQRVTETFRYEHDGDMVNLSIANSNMPLIATSGHEILAIKTNKTYATFLSKRDFKPVCKPENLKFVTADQLEKNDIVAYPRWKGEVGHSPIIDLWNYVADRQFKCDDTHIWYDKSKKLNRFITVDEAFMRLAGYYVSQGGNSKSHKTFNFTISHEKSFQMDEIELLMKEVFGFGERMRLNVRQSTYRLYASSIPVSLMLSDLFGANVYEKRVPEFFLSLNENLLSQFIETAILGDGSTRVPRRVQYDTVSSDLYSSIELILRRLGFVTHVQLRKPSKKGDKHCYRIYVSGTQIGRFAEKMRLPVDLQSLGDTGIQRLAYIDDDYIYFRIKKVSHTQYKGFVYDFKVENDSSYVANGINVHNSPPGYIGYDDGGQLTGPIAKNPHTVLLIDEVEKADKDIWHTFLRIFDEGFMTDAKGNQVDFRNCVIIMTTNLGNQKVVDELTSKGIGFNSNMRASYMTRVHLSRERVLDITAEAIRKHFSPEFINRMDKIITFNQLSDDDFGKIADLELQFIEEKLAKRGCGLTWTKEVLTSMVRDGITTVQGARGLAQLRRDQIENHLADLILTGKYPKGSTFKIDGDYRISAQKPKQVLSLTQAS